MRAGTILRGSSYTLDNSVELKDRAMEKLEDITKQAQSSFNEKLEEYKTMFHEKLESLEEYKTEIEEQFNENFSKQELLFTDVLNNLEQEHKVLVSTIENSMSDYITGIEKDIREIILLLFEKFFFSQYQDMDNLESIIRNSLEQLEESKNIQISLANEYFEKFKKEKKELAKTLTEKNITLNSHLKESLICEIKSDEGNIEIDFNKQMEKIKEIITEF